MTETQEVKFNVQDHTTSCKSLKCNCDYKDLPKTCSIRLLISEMEIEILKGKIIEIQYKNMKDEEKGEVDDLVENAINENKRLTAENLKLKKQIEKIKPQKRTKKSKDDEDDD
jgi:hypothetical protein